MTTMQQADDGSWGAAEEVRTPLLIEWEITARSAYIRARDKVCRRVAHALPPRLKYLAAIDLVACVAADDSYAVGALEAVGRYEVRHGLRR